MAIALRREGPSKFDQASDGSMTLIEHVRELRNRLFWASIGLVVGLVVGFLISHWVFGILREPYCDIPTSWTLQPNGHKTCEFITLGVTDQLMLRLKIALWIGILVGSPVWLYQLWAFIAPGLHRHERKWAYIFVAIATPLFIGGAVIAFTSIKHSLPWIMEAGIIGTTTKLEVTSYVGFVTNMILLFGAAFEFPLILLMLNFTGVVSARKLLSWWRVVVFLSFAFAAVCTPDPGPFGMTLLASCMSALYFISVGIAFINDRRRGRGKEMYAGLDDDALSPLGDDREPVAAGDRVEAVSVVAPAEPVSRPLPIESRFDDMT